MLAGNIRGRYRTLPAGKILLCCGSGISAAWRWTAWCLLLKTPQPVVFCYSAERFVPLLPAGSRRGLHGT